MANFCTKCGNSLEEGKVCDCENNTQEVRSEAVQEQSQTIQTEKVVEGVKSTVEKINSSSIMGEVKEVFKNIFNIYKDPSKLAKKDNSIKTAVISLAIQAIAIFLVLVFSVNRILNAAVSGYGYSSKEAVKIPTDVYVKIFLIILLSCAAFYLIYTGITFLIFNVWKKEKINYKELLGKFAYLMLPLTIMTVVAWLGSYVHSYIVLAAIYYGLIHYCLLTYTYLKENFKTSNNFLTLITPLIIMITLVVGSWLTGKITGIFVPDNITNSLNILNSLDLPF